MELEGASAVVTGGGGVRFYEDGREVDDTIHCALDFENGATLVLEVSWLLHHDTQGEDMQMWLYGKKGGSQERARGDDGGVTDAGRDAGTTDAGGDPCDGWPQSTLAWPSCGPR